MKFESKRVEVTPAIINKEMLLTITGQIGVLRCFGGGLDSELSLREKFKNVLTQGGISTGDRDQGEIVLERGRVGLGKESESIFDSMKGSVSIVDVSRFVRSVADELGWGGQIDNQPLVINTVDDVAKMIDMGRVLGMSIEEETNLRRFLGNNLKENGAVVKEATEEQIRASRKEVGMSDQQERLVDSKRSNRVFGTVEMAAFVKRVVPHVAADTFNM